jgi:hypothetical protein
MSYVIIGAATQVDFDGKCVISAQWGYSANPTRLYCIGSWVPSGTYYKPSESLSITIYAPGPTYTTTPSQSCNDVNTISAGVTPASCDTISLTEFSGSWLVQSYSYTKQDKALPGQETWSLVRWKGLSTPGPTNSIEPTYVLRTISEGQASGNAGIEYTLYTIIYIIGGMIYG